MRRGGRVLCSLLCWAAAAAECPLSRLLTGVNASCAGSGRSYTISAAAWGISLAFSDGMTLALDLEAGQPFVKPDLEQPWQPQTSRGSRIAWVLPREPSASDQPSYMIDAANASITVTRQHSGGVAVAVSAPRCRLLLFEPRPHADLFGNRYQFDFDGGAVLASTQAAFYWGTSLRLVVERTLASGYSRPDGFVLSMLHQAAGGGYDGTYPDVDHEFHIKGRTVLGNPLDDAISRRMIELQLESSGRDPAGLYRIPCAVHPEGDVCPGSPSLGEYHVRRSSKDGQVNAEMFPLTANIGLPENIWLHAAATKDWAWLEAVVGRLEEALGWVELNTDGQGRVWSDVYYEDQCIKDGRTAQAQAFAARAFGIAAELEDRLNRTAQAVRYRELSEKISVALVAPVPVGYWNESAGRFVDWVDRLGQTHDHIHLLANVLPSAFGYATAAQKHSVAELVSKYHVDFQRLPSFVAAKIEDYTGSEINLPYDLCAMGRVWVWDSAYWTSVRNGSMIKWQLMRVASEAALTNYTMAERYDMDHVYYVDGKHYHGRMGYYEYPAAFSWVLHHDLLGLKPSLDADLELAPMLAESGSVTLTQPRIALRWVHDAAKGEFKLVNLATRDRSIAVDLTGLGANRGWSFHDRALGRVHVAERARVELASLAELIFFNDGIID